MKVVGEEPGPARPTTTLEETLPHTAQSSGRVHNFRLKQTHISGICKESKGVHIF